MSQPTIAERTLPLTDEEVAAAYAAAYASCDLDALREVLGADVVSRLLMPGGLRELRGADAFLDELAGAVAGVTGYRMHSSEAEPIGDRFVTRSRLVLEVGSDRFQLEHREVVEVRDGHVVAIDGVCTGFRPTGSRS